MLFRAHLHCSQSGNDILIKNMRNVLREVRGAAKLLYMSGRYKPTVLMYHSIGDNAAHFTVRAKAFQGHLAFLKSRGFQVVGLDECVRRARAGETGKIVALTFDDGYADVAKTAAPILHTYGFPSHVFLIVGRMGQSYETSSGFSILTMTWDQARALKNFGVAFGSHTMTHAKLSKLAPEAAREELSRSKEAIERELGSHDHQWLCYPHGRNTPETRRIAREVGYTGAVTIELGHPMPDSDPFGIPRAYVHSEMGMKEFEACLV